MKTTVQLKFWQTLSQELARGQALGMAIKEARAAIVGEEFEPIAADLAGDVEKGRLLSQAMARHETVFPPAIAAMVRAGEAGDVLGPIAGRIAEGLHDGSFRLPDQPPVGDPMARFWRIFGRLLGSGVPVLQMLDLLQQEMHATDLPQLAEAARTLRQSILNGQTVAQGLRAYPKEFHARLIAAVQAGEQTGDLDGVAMKIADAVEKNDLAGLPEIAAIDTAEASGQAARVWEEILAEAVRSRASDVAIESLEKGRVRVRQRIDGVLHDMRMLPEGSAMALAAYVKALAHLDLAQRRLPQDGRIMPGPEMDLRVSVVPAYYGERFCIRLLRKQEVFLGLDKVGLQENDLARVRRFCHLPQGVVIVNGPTGAGKTTLLYSMLQEIDAASEAIFTIEDPVEYTFDRITQIQVQPEIGLTFTRAMRSVLRQSPDVIMIGELRDLEMINMANQISLTGHLVLTTLHASTSPGALRRVMDIGLPPFLVNASIQGVISMRLARLLCPDCRRPVRIDPAMLPPEAQAFVQRHHDVTWYGANGCESCSRTGYRHRTGLYEVLTMNDAVRQAVSSDAPASRLREVAIDAGMRTMLEDGLAKAAQGLTSIEEVLRGVPRELEQ